MVVNMVKWLNMVVKFNCHFIYESKLSSNALFMTIFVKHNTKYFFFFFLGFQENPIVHFCQKYLEVNWQFEFVFIYYLSPQWNSLQLEFSFYKFDI